MQEAKLHAEKEAAVRRDEICRDALRSLTDDLIKPMLERIARSAPMARHLPKELAVQLGHGMLAVILRESPIGPDVFRNSTWNICAAAQIVVAQKAPRQYRWEASLWFGNIGPSDGMRWYEVSYFDHPMRRGRREQAPFGLADNIPLADEAAGPAMGDCQIAFGPDAIDGEDRERFWSRWITLLARASDGKLEYPRMLPLPAAGF